MPDPDKLDLSCDPVHADEAVGKGRMPFLSFSTPRMRGARRLPDSGRLHNLAAALLSFLLSSPP